MPFANSSGVAAWQAPSESGPFRCCYSEFPSLPLHHPPNSSLASSELHPRLPNVAHPRHSRILKSVLRVHILRDIRIIIDVSRFTYFPIVVLELLALYRVTNELSSLSFHMFLNGIHLLVCISSRKGDK